MKYSTNDISYNIGDVTKIIAQTLVEFGFQKIPHAKDRFSCELTDDSVAYIFFFITKQRTEILIEPNFGVRHNSLMEFLSKSGLDIETAFLPGAKPNWTVSMSFGHSDMHDAMVERPLANFISPGWRLSRAADLKWLEGEIGEALRRYAYPWILRHRTLADSVQVLWADTRLRGNDAAYFAVAAGSHLLGNDELSWEATAANLRVWIPERSHHKTEFMVRRREKIWAFARWLTAEMKHNGWKPSAKTDAEIATLLSCY